MGNFDKERYEGNWYEQYRDKDLWYEYNSDCCTASYTSYSDDTTGFPIGVNNRKYVRSTDTITETRDAWSTRPYANAKLDDQGLGAVKFRFFPEGKYIILDTDYENYTIVYNCDDWFFGFTRAVWMLARKPEIEESYVT